MKISYKVPLIATTVIIAAFAAFSSIQYKLIKDSLYEQTESSITETSTVLGVGISNWLNERIDLVQGISEIASVDPSVENLRRLFSVPRFNEAASYYYGGLDSDGVAINDLDQRWVAPAGWDARKRPWYAVAKRNKTAVMTAPYPDSVDQRLLITAVAQIFDGNRSIGAMGADIELKDISDAINAISFNNTGYAFLINDEGQIITHPNNNYYGKNIIELFQGKVPSIFSSELQHSEADGADVLTAFFPLKQFNAGEKGWLIGVVVDEKKILAPAYQLGINALIASIIAAILSSVVFFLFMRSALITPVNKLTEQADEISRGRLKTELVGTTRKDEIGDLANAIQRLQKSLNMAMNKIRQNR